MHTAQSYLAAGNIPATCPTLTDFISQVRALAGKRVPKALASRLIATAQRIQAVLSC